MNEEIAKRPVEACTGEEATAERQRAEKALRESQALYHSLVEQLPVGIFRKDIEGRYVLVNSWFCKLHGKSPDYLLKKTPLEVSASGMETEEGHQNLRQGADHHVEILRTGKRIELEEQHVGPDGKIKYLHVIKTPVCDADGKIIGSQGILLDITERKEAEAKLNREQNLLRSLMEHSEDRIYFKDLESRFLRCSAAQMRRFKARGLSDVIGKSDRDFFSDEHAKDALGDEQKILRTGEPVIGKVEKETWPDGGVSWALTSKMPLRNETGKIIGTFGISKDITELKRAQEEAAREQARLKFIFDAVPIGISLAEYGPDKQLRERVINDSHLQICGLTRQQDQNPDIYGKITHPGDRERQMRLMREIDEKKSNRFSVEKRYLRPDGKTVWVIFSFQRRYFQDETFEDLCTVVDITESKQAQEEREKLSRQLVDASRQAGMAEVATSVLHNVGNVLNSVNVSSALVSEKVRNSKAANVAKAVALMRQHETDLGDFLANDPKGKQLPTYLENLAAHLADEQKEILQEVNALVENIVHIKEIVAMQQSYAKSFGMVEQLKVSELVDDSLRMNEGALNRHHVSIVRDYAETPMIFTEKHKVLQILVNLIRNAKYACDDSGRDDKQIILRVAHEEGRIKIFVTDNGIGILPENLTRIFNHGFTTRKDGHGFGLHSGAIAAKELGGSLRAISEGHQRGATFVLELPVNRPPKNL
ncbi:MAG TPA: PAS domain S-box protein [Verrucomicrobiae bacterium]|nr:PAS domain S-box protein [Verrucomicrobiae bacterium]